MKQPIQTQAVPKENFTTAQAAEYLNLSEAYMRELRMDGARHNRMTPPPFVRLSSRKVIYRKSDLDAWLEANLVTPKSAHVEVAA